MAQKDYYKIMGVSKDASEKDIKMAYRRLARKYHPDISKEPQAEEHFKEVGEAYEVLKDPAKRAEYDAFQQQGAYQNNAQFHQGFSGHGPSHQEFHFDSDLFADLFGHSRYQNRPMAGENFQGKVAISLEEAFHGTNKQVQVPVEQGQQVTMQTLKVKIPAGIKSGQQIRLAGQGGTGIHGGPRGDLFLTISINPHSLFDLKENDIYLTLPITPWEAALGTKLVVPTLSGKIDLKIPEGSQAGQKLRIKHKGMPGKQPGDQYVLLKIVTPPAKSDAAKALYKQMEETMPYDPRKHLGV